MQQLIAFTLAFLNPNSLECVDFFLCLPLNFVKVRLSRSGIDATELI